MKLNSMLAGAALALATAAGAQAATLAGDTIHAYYIYPNDGAVLNDLGTFTAPGGGHVYIESYQVTGRIQFAQRSRLHFGNLVLYTQCCRSP